MAHSGEAAGRGWGGIFTPRLASLEPLPPTLGGVSLEPPWNYAVSPGPPGSPPLEAPAQARRAQFRNVGGTSTQWSPLPEAALSVGLLPDHLSAQQESGAASQA